MLMLLIESGIIFDDDAKNAGSAPLIIRLIRNLEFYLVPLLTVLKEYIHDVLIEPLC